jgi:hypothetical protein
MIDTVEKKYFENRFNCYKMVKEGVTYYVPLDEANRDYQAIQEWIEAGNSVIDNPPE